MKTIGLSPGQDFLIATDWYFSLFKFPPVEHRNISIAELIIPRVSIIYEWFLGKQNYFLEFRTSD